MSTWYTSDTHFGHDYVARLRGFAGAAAHDAEIIRRWNARVRPPDTVWLLGDVTLRRLAAVRPLVAQLNGTIHLVAGNHDACWPGHRDAHRHQAEWLQVFASVQPFARRRIAGQPVLLSHLPYRGDRGEERCTQYRLRDEGAWLLHGHTHSVSQGDGRQIHVGLDARALAPVHEREIEQRILAAG